MTFSKIMTFEQEGISDIVNNLGSLAARFVFRPIEENSYFYFTQTLSRDIPLKEQPRDKVEQASSVLYNLLKVVTSIGLIGLVFGQSYAKTVLTLYGGTKFVEDEHGLSVILLRGHALAIIFLAINGICEGYMFAAMTSTEISKLVIILIMIWKQFCFTFFCRFFQLFKVKYFFILKSSFLYTIFKNKIIFAISRYNYYMTFFSGTFLLLSYVLSNFFGPVGFILANCTNMGLRIIFSCRYILRQYQSVGLKPLDGVWPNTLFLITLIVLGITCKISEVTEVQHHSFVFYIFL